MQTRPALIRVAAECAQDLAADGVVYAEVRYAPELSTTGGLSLDEVVDAIIEGFRVGSASDAWTADRGPLPGHGNAPGRSSRRDRRAGPAPSRRRRGRLRHRRSRGGLPTRSLRRRLRATRPRQLPSHPARRRGLRPALDPRGTRPGRRAPRPRGPDRGRHRPGRVPVRRCSAAWRPTSAIGGSRSSCAQPRTSTPARRRRSRPIPSSCSAGCASGSRSTPTIG